MLVYLVVACIGASLALASPNPHHLHRKALMVVKGGVATKTIMKTVFVSAPVPATGLVQHAVNTNHGHVHTVTITVHADNAAGTSPAEDATGTSFQASLSVVESIQQPSQASQTPVAAVVDSDNPLASIGVEYHNLYRAKHSAGPVIWNASIAAAAQKLADTCVFEHQMGIDGGGYGQNINAEGIQDNPNWKTLQASLNDSIIAWYSEVSLVKQYDQFGRANIDVPKDVDVLHFTQLVWKSTTAIGCAVKACPMNTIFKNNMYTWYTVCNYYPPGNWGGEYAQMVSEN